MYKITFALSLFFFSFYASSEALKDYISSVGPYSNSREISHVIQDDIKITMQSFKSQNWHGGSWEHALLVFEPEESANSEIGFLVLGGGNNEKSEDLELFQKKLSSSEAKLAFEAAKYNKVRSAVLFNVPNQPLLDGKKENELLATSFDQYSKTGDKTWPLLFPMVTSAVKALDLLSNRWELQKFILSGASKRGWATYLTGAVDERVIAIAPAVFQMLNIPEQINLTRLRYGQDSAQLKAFSQLKLTERLDEPRIKELVNWVDPVSYSRILSLPKFLLLGSNDPYWIVDAVSVYWWKFTDRKLLRVLPNTAHGVLDSKSGRDSLRNFINEISKDTIPKLSWRIKTDKDSANLSIQSSQIISGVRMYVADAERADLSKSVFHETGFANVNSKNYDLFFMRGKSPWRVVLFEVWLEGEKVPFTVEPVVLSSDSTKLSLADVVVQ